MAKGRKLAAELHREAVNRAYAKRTGAEHTETPYWSCEYPACACACGHIAGTCEYCHWIGAVYCRCPWTGGKLEGDVCPIHGPAEVAPSRSAAEKIESMCLALEPCPDCGSDKHQSCEASAAPPSEREALEQQAAYYFSEIRKFSPLNLDHYSLENWKDFIVWREARAAVPAPGAEAEHLEMANSRRDEITEDLDRALTALRLLAQHGDCGCQHDDEDCCFKVAPGECAVCEYACLRAGATAPPKRAE